jgi:ribosomal-protein-serine acetyltransferase
MTESTESIVPNVEPNVPHQELFIDEGLQLKQLDLSQAERLFELTEQDRAYLSQWLPWPEHTKSIEDSREFIETMIAKRASGEEYGYGIQRDGMLVGHISLMHVKDDHVAEIGYWIASSAAGKGITTRAAARLSHFSFETLGLERVIIRADPGNIGSNKVAENIGYKFVGKVLDEDTPLNVWEMTKAVHSHEA